MMIVVFNSLQKKSLKKLILKIQLKIPSGLNLLLELLMIKKKKWMIKLKKN